MELGGEDKEIMDAGEEAGVGGGRVRRGGRQRTSFTENVTMQRCSESRLPPTLFSSFLSLLRCFFVVVFSFSSSFPSPSLSRSPKYRGKHFCGSMV